MSETMGHIVLCYNGTEAGYEITCLYGYDGLFY